jgi:hypothetical protein
VLGPPGRGRSGLLNFARRYPRPTAAAAAPTSVALLCTTHVHDHARGYALALTHSLSLSLFLQFLNTFSSCVPGWALRPAGHRPAIGQLLHALDARGASDRLPGPGPAPGSPHQKPLGRSDDFTVGAMAVLQTSRAQIERAVTARASGTGSAGAGSGRDRNRNHDGAAAAAATPAPTPASEGRSLLSVWEELGPRTMNLAFFLTPAFAAAYKCQVGAAADRAAAEKDPALFIYPLYS